MADPFHWRLRELAWDRAAGVVGDLMDPRHLDVLRHSEGNFLARIENTSPGSGAGALACMAVPVPNEAHLLAAIHLAHRGLHVTMNFDDGIERAYSLLTGEAELAASATAAQRRVLPGWRACVPDPAPPLVVRWRPESMVESPGVRPLLVKLHGSMGVHPDGVTLPLGPTSDDVDAGDLGMARWAAVAQLREAPAILVTGFSARDLASRAALFGQLSCGRFAWVAPAVDDDIRALITAVDPDQPVSGLATQALRAMLPSSPPAWPAGPPPPFAARLERWAAGLSPDVAAEAVGWALCDAGEAEAGLAILRRLVRTHRSPGVTLRLADAVARRGPPAAVPAARRTLLRVASARDARGRRALAIARWAEAWPTPTGSRVLSGVAGVVVGSAVTVATSLRDPSPQARIRTATVVLGRVLGLIESTVAGSELSPPERRATRSLARAGARLASRVLTASRAAPSGRRRAMLERQRIELEAIDALLGGPLVRGDRFAALDRLGAVFEHVADHQGAADTAGTRALVALAAGDMTGCDDALALANRGRATVGGVVGMTEAIRSRSR